MRAVKVTNKPTKVSAGLYTFQWARNPDGVMQLWADDDESLAAALGFAHAWDRCVQLCMMRLIGEGRLGECLKADDETLGIDTFMRQQGFAQTAREELRNVSAKAATVLDAYVIGVNEGLKRRGRPFEFRLAGYKPEPWERFHTLLVIKMMTYIGLAQCQQDVEKLIIEAVANGVDTEKLRSLFFPHLDGMTNAIVDLIKRTQRNGTTLPAAVRFLAPLPRLMASNNWAVSKDRSTTGGALQANDPHLEVNRLPSIWYEFIGHVRNDYRMGVGIPGLPGLVMGRTQTVSYGFTYGFMDMIDLFIEDIADGKCRRADQWEPLVHTRDTVKRKGKADVTVNVFRSSVGFVEVAPEEDRCPDGMRLAVAYSAHDRGAAESLDALVRLSQSQNVEESQNILTGISVSANWIIADNKGHIGYQQSGFFPKRVHSGLHPLPAWDTKNLWQGLQPSSALVRITDPSNGVLVSANGAHNLQDGPLAVNLHGGEYRRRRIEELLAENSKLSLLDMTRIQCDLESLQAHDFLSLIRPYVVQNRAGKDLLAWDAKYDVGSIGAPIFEAIYAALLEEVFAPVFGAQAWDSMIRDTHILASYYCLFDEVLLRGDESWFGNEGRSALFKRVVRSTLMAIEERPRATWGAGRRIRMKHILLGGQLPNFLGLDHGPIELPGVRATIVQGSIMRSYGRETSFAPSYRIATDMGTNEAMTILAGGPSERPLSRWYTRDVKAWLSFGYKRIAPTPTP
jgi:penicillin G amidase